MKLRHILLTLAASSMLASCLEKGEDTFSLSTHYLPGGGTGGGAEVEEPEKEPADIIGIPSDNEANKDPETGTTPNIPEGDGTTDIPNAPTVVIGSDKYGYIPLSGIEDKDGNWLTLLGTGREGQNTWLDIDGVAKGIDAIPCSEAYKQLHEYAFKTPTDVVFTINSSKTMSDEVDALASGLLSWAESLDTDGINLQVGCVSYDEGDYSINGAIDLATATVFNEYLQREGLSGYTRARGFWGENATALEKTAKSEKYQLGYNTECDVLAIRFANDNFTFRSGANRVYIDVTDEPNQTGKKPSWSVTYFDPEAGNWVPDQGTIHCIYNGDRDYTEVEGETEHPWRMSEYTGGTCEFFDGTFGSTPLTDLKVTWAMKKSHLLRFRTLPEYFDGKKHSVKLTVRTPDGTTYAQKTINMQFTEK